MTSQTCEPKAKKVELQEMEERFKRYLYAQGGKVTGERLALLRTLYLNEGHFSVDELMTIMRDQGLSVSRATAYRTLDLLVQSGLIRKLTMENQETRYEFALTSDHHDHIMCVDCQKIIEFYNPKLAQLQDEILAEYQLTPVKYVHQLYGACMRKDCPEKKSRSK